MWEGGRTGRVEGGMGGGGGGIGRAGARRGWTRPPTWGRVLGATVPSCLEAATGHMCNVQDAVCFGAPRLSEAGMRGRQGRGCEGARGSWAEDAHLWAGARDYVIADLDDERAFDRADSGIGNGNGIPSLARVAKHTESRVFALE
jgi:hypothetical protein